MRQKTEKRGFKPGDVVIVRNVPFHDKLGAKTRPMLVLSSGYHNQVRQDMVVAVISGQPVAGPWDLSVDCWQEAGLQRPSKVVCDSIITVLQESAVSVGHIDPETLDEIKVNVALILELCKECDELDG
jgi:mRNA-degrading endonuclease toxin of MazEF toxin-antitoxin module